ncbi:hypothetical protein QQP08_027334 [Theobroma cacao]|nr:hypothetical protein QQP08_027334 [Theobroma cacao]
MILSWQRVRSMIILLSQIYTAAVEMDRQRSNLPCKDGTGFLMSFHEGQLGVGLASRRDCKL